MCLLTYTEAGEWPDMEKLEDASAINGDGFGWSIVHDGRLRRGASMSIDEALTTYSVALRESNGPSMFHLRWATHGVKDLTNVHPFKADRGRTMIGHNGIIDNVKTFGTESDTAAFVRRYWPSWANRDFDKPETFRHLERWIGSGNKLVILTTDPRYKSDHYIVNEKAGHWDNGTWYSNTSYRWCEYTYSAPYVPYAIPLGTVPGGCPAYAEGCLCDECRARWARVKGYVTPDCKGYANACQCADCSDRDTNLPGEYYPVRCGVCRTEYITEASTAKPVCPTCGVCWYCDSDQYACLCDQGEI